MLCFCLFFVGLLLILQQVCGGGCDLSEHCHSVHGLHRHAVQLRAHARHFEHRLYWRVCSRNDSQVSFFFPFRALFSRFASLLQGLRSGKVSFVFFFRCSQFSQLIALGPKGYFSDGWLVLDFLIVIGSVADVIVTFAVEVQSVSISIIRVLRLFALLKLMRVRPLLFVFFLFCFVFVCFCLFWFNLFCFILFCFVFFFCYYSFSFLLLPQERQEASYDDTDAGHFCAAHLQRAAAVGGGDFCVRRDWGGRVFQRHPGREFAEARHL